MPKKPLAIVDEILSALQANDCPSVHLHVDDLQEALVARLMAGDFRSQAVAHERLLARLREANNLGEQALQALLVRIDIDNRTAFKIIERHDDPLVNEAVCKNLMFHKPPALSGYIGDMGLALYWLGSGDHEIFSTYATSLLDKPCDKMDLQKSIIHELFGVRGDAKDVYCTWLARNQEKIIALSQGDDTNFKNIALHRGLMVFDEHMPTLAHLMITTSQQSPNLADLYNMRTKLGVTLQADRLQKEWKGLGASIGWSSSTLQALMIYHLAFDDSPAPEAIGGQDTEAVSALVQAMYFLQEKGIEPNPVSMSQILTILVNNLEEEDLLSEGINILNRSEFRRHFLVNPTLRENNFGADLGL